MKITYSNKIPKCRTRAYSPCGLMFNFDWTSIVYAIEEYRKKHDFDKRDMNGTRKIDKIHVTDKGVCFVYED